MKKLRLCWIDDGKAGHRNQTLGLIRALSKRLELSVEKRSPLLWSSALKTILTGHWPAHRGTYPDWVVGTGHRTHLTLLAMRRCFACKAIVLMKPSLPLGLFDAVIAPEHDGVAEGGNRLITQGVLNSLGESDRRDERRGLILIGGASRHFRWQLNELVEQIEQIITAQSDMTWHLANSRRTPKSARKVLQALTRHFHPVEVTSFDEIVELMYASGQIWVTADSASMLFEALSTGAVTGVIEMEQRARTRLAVGVQKLLEHNRLAFLDRNGELHWPENKRILQEADRVADWLIGKFL